MTGNVDHERLLTPGEVAAMFRVDAKTVTRWARNGKLSSIRTLGGHRRYRAGEVLMLIEQRTKEIDSNFANSNPLEDQS